MWRGGLGDSMDFATSSHRTRWLFTRSELEEKRRTLQAAVVESVRKQRAAADPGEPEAGSATKRSREPPPVPLSGEVSMLKYYQQIIQEKCREMKMPAKVMATAIMYHKRFFLRHTSMEFDPGRIMTTAIFMATKIEEYYTRAPDLAKSFGISEDIVIKHEVQLLEGLNFDLVVHSPYRALQGLVEELKHARASPSASSITVPGAAEPQELPPLDAALVSAPDDTLRAACRAAFGSLDALMLSDAPLLYGPAQLAAAALRSGFKAQQIGIPNFIARLALRAAAAAASNGAGGRDESDLLRSASGSLPADPAAALTSVMDELDSLGHEGSRKVQVNEVKDANAAAREWRALIKTKDKDAAGGAGAAGAGKGGAAGDDAARAAKREAKKAARAAAKAKQEAELLGMPQQ